MRYFLCGLNTGYSMDTGAKGLSDLLTAKWTLLIFPPTQTHCSSWHYRADPPHSSTETVTIQSHSTTNIVTEHLGASFQLDIQPMVSTHKPAPFPKTRLLHLVVSPKLLLALFSLHFLLTACSWSWAMNCHGLSCVDTSWALNKYCQNEWSSIMSYCTHYTLDNLFSPS